MRLTELRTFAIIPGYIDSDTVTRHFELSIESARADGRPIQRRSARQQHKTLQKFKRTMNRSASGSFFAERVQPMWHEMLLCKAIDAMEYYLQQVLHRAIRKNPKSISDAAIKVEELLQARDLDHAIQRAIEKQVYDASFTGLSGIADFLEKRFGLKLDRKSADFLTLEGHVELRHLVVHNASRVSKRYLQRVPTTLQEGDRFVITAKHVMEVVDAVNRVASEIDSQLLAKQAI